MKTTQILSSLGIALALVGPACSTSFIPIGSDNDAGTATSCSYNGQQYAVGANFSSTDGCNSCSCGADGLVACTLLWCDGVGGAAGVGGSTGVTCLYNGTYYAVGASFKSADGCNGCSCSSNGLVGCTTMACAVGGATSAGGATSTTCTYNGVHYLAGTSFKSSDGCNTCSCTSSGAILCTEMACAATGGASGGTGCPAVKLIMPDCGTSVTAVPTYDASGCLTGYVCPGNCPVTSMPVVDCANYQIVTDPATGCAIGYTCPVADASACAAVPVPQCVSGATPTVTYDATGCVIYSCN